MANVPVEMVFVFLPVTVKNMVVHITQENVQMIQMTLNVVIIFLAKLTTEDQETVNLLINVVVIMKLLLINVQEVVTLNVVFRK